MTSFAQVKKDIPNAEWRHLVTGVVIFALVVVFSVSYFSKGNTPIDLSDLTDSEIMIENEATEVTAGEESMVDETTTDTTMAKVEAGEGETVVQKGEGLWHVAKRVCGAGEKYNKLAEANGMTIYSEVAEGQVLKVVCE